MGPLVRCCDEAAGSFAQEIYCRMDAVGNVKVDDLTIRTGAHGLTYGLDCSPKGPGALEFRIHGKVCGLRTKVQEAVVQGHRLSRMKYLHVLASCRYQ